MDSCISQHQSVIWGHKMNWLAWWLVISMLIISNSHILFILSQTCFSPSAEIVYTSYFIFYCKHASQCGDCWQSKVVIVILHIVHLNIMSFLLYNIEYMMHRRKHCFSSLFWINPVTEKEVHKTWICKIQFKSKTKKITKYLQNRCFDSKTVFVRLFKIWTCLIR